MALIGKFLLAIQRWCRDSYDKNEAFKKWELRESPDAQPPDPKWLKPISRPHD